MVATFAEAKWFAKKLPKKRDMSWPANLERDIGWMMVRASPSSCAGQQPKQPKGACSSGPAAMPPVMQPTTQEIESIRSLLQENADSPLSALLHDAIDEGPAETKQEPQQSRSRWPRVQYVVQLVQHETVRNRFV